MKNILILSSQGMEDTSGFGRCFPIAKELAKRGFKVNILAVHSNYASLKDKKFLKEGVNIYYVGQMHVLKSGNKKYYFNKFQLIKTVLFSTLKMCYYGLITKTDVIYCFKPQPVNGTAALLLKLIKQKPIILDCDDYEASSSKLNTFQLQIFKFFEYRVPYFSYKITHNTHFIKEHLISLGINSDKFIYIHDGVDWDRLKTPDEKKLNSLKEKLKLVNKKVVLYFGTISLNFGHSIDLLIKAFPFVKNKIPDSKLLIVGGGDAFDVVKQMVSKEVMNDVIFTGRVSFEDLPYYLKLGDVSVDPVRDVIANKARYALKITESIAMKIPLVTSDIGDRKLALENEKVGILVKIGDEKALAEGIIKILENEELGLKMSNACAEVIKTHNWDYLVDKIIEKTPFLQK